MGSYSEYQQKSNNGDALYIRRQEGRSLMVATSDQRETVKVARQNTCMMQNYSWPELSKDVLDCDQCQKTKRKFDHPSGELYFVPVSNNNWMEADRNRLIGPAIGNNHKW